MRKMLKQFALQHYKVFQLNKRDRIIILGLIVLLFVLMYFMPETWVHKKPFCIYYNVVGKQCPFCGMTRSMFYLSHFNLSIAINYNPLIILLLIFIPIECLDLIISGNNTKIIRFYMIIATIILIFMLFIFRTFLK